MLSPRVLENVNFDVREGKNAGDGQYVPLILPIRVAVQGRVLAVSAGFVVVRIVPAVRHAYNSY
jgi:hypothetical protein